MMVTHFVFKIGPVPMPERQATAYVVMPSEEGSTLFLADDDGSGLAQVLEAYDAASFECEPELAVAAADLHVHAGAITPQRAYWMGSMAFDMALPNHFDGVDRAEAVHVFAAACGAYWQAAPWRRAALAKPMAIRLEGAVSGPWVGRIVAGSDNGFSLCPDQESAQSAHPASLTVEFSPQPEFAADVMRRAYGLPRLPIPSKKENGQSARLSTGDLLTLGAALNAVAALTDEAHAAAGGKVVADDLEVGATVRLID